MRLLVLVTQSQKDPQLLWRPLRIAVDMGEKRRKNLSQKLRMAFKSYEDDRQSLQLSILRISSQQKFMKHFMKLLLVPIVEIAEESLSSPIVLLQQRVQSKVVPHASGMPDPVLKHLHSQPTSPPLSDPRPW